MTLWLIDKFQVNILMHIQTLTLAYISWNRYAESGRHTQAHIHTQLRTEVLKAIELDVCRENMDGDYNSLQSWVLSETCRQHVSSGNRSGSSCVSCGIRIAHWLDQNKTRLTSGSLACCVTLSCFPSLVLNFSISEVRSLAKKSYRAGEIHSPLVLITRRRCSAFRRHSGL